MNFEAMEGHEGVDTFQKEDVIIIICEDLFSADPAAHDVINCVLVPYSFRS